MPPLLVSATVNMEAQEEEGKKGPTAIQKSYQDWPVPEIGSYWAMEATGHDKFFMVEEVIHTPDRGYIEVGLEPMEPDDIKALLDSDTGWINPDA